MKQVDLTGTREELDAIMRAYGLPPEALILVPSVKDWATEHGLTEPNPFRQATSYPEKGLIVMRSSLSEDDARSSASYRHIGIEMHEQLARDLKRYMRFLLLHEIAHLRGLHTEEAADIWALAELRRQEGN